MKKLWIVVLVIGLFGSTASAHPVQEDKPAEQEIRNEMPVKPPSYNPAGRRDPFKDLLAGREVKEKVTGGIPQLSIDDVKLIGIVKAREKLTAVVSGPHEFPYFIKVGDKFADGYVLSIQESKVVFRKLSERGMPLMKPKDIVKEIYPEER